MGGVMSTFAAKASPSTFINILFTTDFSEESMHALPYVTGIARKLPSTVYLGYIVTHNPLVAGAPGVAPPLYKSIREQAAAQLTDLALSTQFTGLAAKTIVGTGPIGVALCEMVANGNIKLIVAGTHGRTGVRKLLLGSVVEEIIRVATCPVLTVGPGLAPRQEIQFTRILFPTDFSAESKRVLPYVRYIAEQYGAAVTVLHVMPEELVPNPDAARLAEPICSTMVHTFETELAGLDLEFLIDFGEAVETILRTAKARNADLIAIGIRNTFLPGTHLRSTTAYRIMAGAHCPVLTYRHGKGE
jgi:nucleotide-binding universal stress UspA family protein